MLCAQRSAGKPSALGERAQPVARVVLAHDEDAVGLLDDGEPSAIGALTPATADGHHDLVAAHLDRVAAQRDLRDRPGSARWARGTRGRATGRR